MFKHSLGQLAKDKITDFKGIIVCRSQHMFGCNTYGLAPQVLKDGKRVDTEWFDEGRIEVIGEGINPTDVAAEKPGSEYREHPKA